MAISPEIVLAHKELSVPFANLINTSLSRNVFPDAMQSADVSPIFKKDGNLLKGNFTPVNILTGISKIHENVVNYQHLGHFNRYPTTFSVHFVKTIAANYSWYSLKIWRMQWAGYCQVVVKLHAYCIACCLINKQIRLPSFYNTQLGPTGFSVELKRTRCYFGGMSNLTEWMFTVKSSLSKDVQRRAFDVCSTTLHLISMNCWTNLMYLEWKLWHWGI